MITNRTQPTTKAPDRPETHPDAPRPPAVPPGNPDAIDEVPALAAILVYEADDVVPPRR